MRTHPLTALALACMLIACMAEPHASERFVARLRAAPPAELWLSQTGLYADLAHKRVSPALHAYEPAFALWTDGAAKHRWLYLPPGARIDSSDMDRWSFPIGTVAFKEFARDGRRIETRVIARIDVDAYWMGAFLWNEDESDARYAPEGMVNARGTDHDIPSAAQCASCHNGEPGKLLGFSAVQLPRTPDALLSHPIAEPFTPPGDAVTARALGYLHANCAHCHNPRGSARPDTAMNLRLSVHDRTPGETAAYRTTVGQPLQSFTKTTLHQRVASAAPEASAVLLRMSTRDPTVRMPPLGSEHVDAAGSAAVRAWIAGLDRGPVAR